MVEGYDSSIPVHFLQIVDEWEADAVAQQLANPGALSGINHY